MTQLTSITLENEMDLTLAYKRSIITAGLLGLTVSTQTAFATAVSEVCREVIDKAMEGVALLGAINDGGRFFMVAHITCKTDDEVVRLNGGLEYARKLVPVLNVRSDGGRTEVLLKLGIPRATKIDQAKVISVKARIEADGPVSAYEEVKMRNAMLSDINQQQELALIDADLLNRKKNEFLSVASHELNSPLTVLRSYAQIALRMEGGKDPKLNAYLTRLDTQTGKLVSLVRQLMDISKMENGINTYNMQVMSINDLFNDIIDPLRLLVSGHNVMLTLDDDRNLTADPLKMEQVITNIVTNAAKYSETGSLIRISTTVSGDTLTIAIEDEGIGMSAESQQRVFEKFYRDKEVERRSSGLGMGLYIASKIVKDHEGIMRVESAEGAGSTFYCDFPVSNN